VFTVHMWNYNRYWNSCRFKKKKCSFCNLFNLLHLYQSFLCKDAL